ncbi:MAG: ATP-dependent DNA helicase RecG [Deltaproteobacteria bacterium]|nr:MAG: ATP-dependent DNA helicase RecG [Deltaproteobacteria bacterium]
MLKEKAFSYPINDERLAAPIHSLKGIGSKRAEALERKGIRTIEELLFFFPFRYEDRRKIVKLSEVSEGMEALVWGRIASAGEERLLPSGKRIFKIELDDGTGRLALVWFHYQKAHMWQLVSHGKGLCAFGKVRFFKRRAQIVHPDVQVVDTPRPGGLEPIYSEVKGVSSRVLRNAITQALDKCLDALVDPIPAWILERMHLPGLVKCIRALHTPSPDADADDYNALATPFHQRVRFDRFFWVMLVVLLRKYARQGPGKVRPLALPRDFLHRFTRALPFPLTDDQVHVIREIADDMQSGRPMNRLVQGDVGCGKTVVGAAAAFMAVSNGFQVALMAPTQILARQHFVFFSNLPSQLGFRPILLTGALKGNERAKVYNCIRHGDCNVIIGTQALIQEEVIFHRLGLIIIDEQHRFGVRQRSLLAQKANHPHVLVMTATPIPRTLAMVVYADLDVSVIRTRPPGYKGVITEVVPDREKRRIYDIVTKRMEQGEQVVVICPVIEGQEGSDLKNALDMFEGLRRLYSPRFTVALIHGELPPGEKDAVMEAFRAGRIQLLVATTVVEVGVHAPGATVMVIEHPERFGLAQLHQLRGRVGRGEREGLCLLVKPAGIPEQAEERLRILVSCDDGFEISEQDLLLRGQGELVGIRQSGVGELDMREVINYPNLLMAAREVAEQLLQDDPHLSKPEHDLVKRHLMRIYGKQAFHEL